MASQTARRQTRLETPQAARPPGTATAACQLLELVRRSVRQRTISAVPATGSSSTESAADDTADASSQRIPTSRSLLEWQPTVSVVIPAYNAEATIAECIEALLAQDYPKGLTEIVVVDNGSTDDTRVIASRYPVTIAIADDIRTSYAARNHGIACSNGEVIALTDSDCIPTPTWLSDLIAPLADMNVGASLGTVEAAQPETLCEEFTERVQPFARPEPRGLKTLLTINVALRRRTLEALGCFDERLPTGGDVDLGWRLQERLGLTFADAPKAKVFHRHRRRFTDVFRQYRRYGLSEVLLATIYEGEPVA